MVDVERVERLLNRVSDDLRVLRELGRRDVRRDVTALAAMKYRFITAIEGCARIAQHLSASEGWPVPDSNGAAIKQLAREGVVGQQAADSLARAVGFRNVLVHEYVDVDDEHVISNLERLGDLDAFVREVAAWLVGRDEAR